MKTKICNFINNNINHFFVGMFFVAVIISDINVRYLYPINLNFIQIFVYSIFASSIVLAINKLIKYKKAEKLFINRKDIIPLLFVVVINFIGGGLIYSTALYYLPFSQVTILYALFPIIFYLASLKFFKNEQIKFSFKVFSGLILCLIGLFCVLYSYQSIVFIQSLIGIALIIIGLLFALVYVTVVRRYFLSEMAYIIIGHIIVCIFGFVFLTFNHLWVMPSFRDFFYIVIAGICYNIVIPWLSFGAIKYFTIEKLSYFSYYSSFTGVLLNIALYSLTPSYLALCGLTAFLVGNIIIVNRTKLQYEYY